MHAQPPGAILRADHAQSIRYLSIGLFGAVMSLAGLSLVWRHATRTYGASSAVSDGIGVIAMAVFVVLALSYLWKCYRYRAVVDAEFSHPVTGNFFGTVGISVLLLSSVAGAWSSTAQMVVWLAGVVVTLAFSTITVTRLLGGDGLPASVVPAWLIAGVGSLDIVVTGGSFTAAWAHEINLLAAAVGSISALVFFTLIFSRLVHVPLAAGMRPSMMILVAPFAVGFIAYVNMTHGVDMFAALLFYVGLFLFVIVGYRLLRERAPFSQGWWAVGFPVAALSNAAMVYADAAGGAALAAVAIALLCVISATVAILSFGTLRALVTGRLLLG